MSSRYPSSGGEIKIGGVDSNATPARKGLEPSQGEVENHKPSERAQMEGGWFTQSEKGVVGSGGTYRVVEAALVFQVQDFQEALECFLEEVLELDHYFFQIALNQSLLVPKKSISGLLTIKRKWSIPIRDRAPKKKQSWRRAP